MVVLPKRYNDPLIFTRLLWRWLCVVIIYLETTPEHLRLVSFTISLLVCFCNDASSDKQISMQEKYAASPLPSSSNCTTLTEREENEESWNHTSLCPPGEVIPNLSWLDFQLDQSAQPLWTWKNCHSLFLQSFLICHRILNSVGIIFMKLCISFACYQWQKHQTSNKIAYRYISKNSYKNEDKNELKNTTFFRWWDWHVWFECVSL